MECTNTIDIRGSIERVYELGANIQEWPRILPHYRYVHVDESSPDHRVARMGAVRPLAPFENGGNGNARGFPVSWRARQELRPDERRILFKHIGGVTRGMEVEWRLEPLAHGVRVTIFHALSYPLPLLGPLFAEHVVGRFFVSNIAGTTLCCIKRMVEDESGSAGLS